MAERSVRVRIDAEISGYDRKLDTATLRTRAMAREIDNADSSMGRLGRSSDSTGREIDRLSGRMRLLGEAVVILGPSVIPLTAALGGLAAALSAPIAAGGAGATLYGILTGQAVKQTEDQKKKIDQLQKAVESARTSLANANASAATSQANSIASAQRSAALSLASAEQSAQKSIASAKQSLATATTASAKASAQQRIDAAQKALADRKATIAQQLANSQASASASATASQEAAQRRVNDAVKAYHDALDALSPAQKRFLDAQDNLKASFQRFIDREGPALLGPLTAGMNDAIDLLPSVSPVIRDVGSALDYLLDEVDRSAKSGTIRDFLDLMERASGPAIVSFGTDLGNIGAGITGLLDASEPLSHTLLPVLERMTGDFADFGKNADSNGFHDFLAYVQQEGPEAAHFISELAGALAAVVRDAAPIGGTVLHVLTDLVEVLHAVADSPAGPVLFSTAAGLLAVNRAMILAQGFKGSEFFSFLKGDGKFAGMTRLPAALAGVGFALSQLGSHAGDAGQGVSVLGDALTGAALGSAFGPWGTAIGGASGALIGLVSDIKHSDHVIGDSKPIVSDYADTFDRLTGSITRATRANVFQDLQKSGAVKAAADLGLSAKTLTDAALGNVHAQRLVSDALANTRRNVLQLQNAQRRDFANKTAYMEYKKQIDALEGSYNLVKGSVDQTSAAIRKQQKDARDARGALIDYTKTFKDFPKRAVTEIKATGLPETMADVIDLAHRYDLTPKQVNTLVKVSGTGPAKQQIHEVQAALDKLHDRNIHLNVIRQQGAGLGGSQRGQSREAFAGGGQALGYVRGPGTTTSDSIPALLSDREYVVKAAAVDKYGVAMMESINSMRFAAGGLATRSFQPSTTNYYSTGASIDYGRLAAAMLNARSLYGDVHVHGDGSFRRTLLEDHQRAALGVLQGP